MTTETLETLETLISPENTVALMALTCGWVSCSIYAEQRWQWASKLTGALLAMVGAMVFTNVRILPTNAPWFDDIIWGYVVPLAIPLLLLQCDIRKIWKESGRLLLLYLVGAVGTSLSGVLAFFLFRDAVPEAAAVAAMMTGSYIGGSVNLVAVAETFSVSPSTLSAATVADNFLTACYLFTLISIAGSGFFQNFFSTHSNNSTQKKEKNQNQSMEEVSTWKPKEKKPLSLPDIGLNMAISSGIVWLSQELSSFMIGISPENTFVSGVLGNPFLIMSTVTMILATFCGTSLEKVNGSEEIGTYFMYLFLFAIGVPASLGEILGNAPLLFVFCFVMVATNMLFVFTFGKLMHFELEEMILASNANIGGPTTATAMAISRGWHSLVGPVMMIGTWGYVLGTWAGVAVGVFLGG